MTLVPEWKKQGSGDTTIHQSGHQTHPKNRVKMQHQHTSQTTWKNATDTCTRQGKTEEHNEFSVVYGMPC